MAEQLNGQNVTKTMGTIGLTEQWNEIIILFVLVYYRVYSMVG